MLNRNHIIPACVLLTVLSAVTGLAQRPAASPARPAATPTSPPTTAAPANVQLPISKMAVIDTDAFLDPKSGITKFSAAVNKLNGEFQKTKDEIAEMQTRGTQLQAEITKLQSAPPGTPIDQKSLQAKVDQLEQLKKDLQRKSEDAQAAYNKRRQDLFAPLEQEVGNALEVFAKARGINVIIDSSQVPLLYAADSIDITRAFIAEFNSKNPATASTAPPE